ncbi:hypothetical protein CLOP_g12958 [Closterium sp. NIES-67]|nr:hypothetical protein CLOP_g12958 [Closterium sp. NIES-67]
MGVGRTGAGRTAVGRTGFSRTHAHRRACQLSTEIHTLLAVMRQSSKWAVSPIFLDETSGADAEDPLLRNLKDLRQKIVTDWSDDDWEAARVPPSAYLVPFLDVVRSERTNTIVTSVALSSILKILNLQFFDQSTPGAAVGIHMVMDAVTSCRFEVTDLASEEAVLVKILQVLLETVRSPAGPLLSDRHMCSIVNTCFRVLHQAASKSHLLQRLACQTLLDMVREIFGRLPELPASEEDGELGEGEATQGTMDSTPFSPRVEAREGGMEEGKDGGLELGGATVEEAEGGEGRDAVNAEQAEAAPTTIGAAGGLTTMPTTGRASSSSTGSEPHSIPTANGLPPTSASATPKPSHPTDPNEQPRGQGNVSRGEAGEEGEEEDGERAGSNPNNASLASLGRPHGVACAVEVFHFLCSLLGLEDHQSALFASGMLADDDVSLLALSLISAALELAGPSVVRHPRLLSLIQDELFRSLLQLGLSPNLLVLSQVLAIVQTLFHSARPHLKLQLEAFYTCVLGRLVGTAGKFTATSFAQQEAALEALLDFCRLPEFAVETFANFDADLTCANCLEELSGLLSRAAFPVNTPLSSLHVLAMQGLLAVVHHMADRANTAAAAAAAAAAAGSAATAGVAASAGAGAGVAAPNPLLLPGSAVPAAPELKIASENGAMWTQAREMVAAALAAAAIAGAGEGATGMLVDVSASADGFQRQIPSQQQQQQQAGQNQNQQQQQLLLVEVVRQQRSIKRRLLIGVEHFNRDSKKGLQFLQSSGLLPPHPDARAVACFLRFTPGLNKTLVGDLLGGHDEFHVRVLGEFAKLFDFEGMALDAALRTFLEGFRLPGEAQKISRVLEAFAERYYELAPAAYGFANHDVAYVLSYSVIMLNTDLYNGQVRRKMTEEEFIRNNRKINDGKDLPRELLSDLYHAIARNEIKMSSDVSLSSSSASAFPEMNLSRWLGLIRRSPTAVPYILAASAEPDLFSSAAAADGFGIGSGAGAPAGAGSGASGAGDGEGGADGRSAAGIGERASTESLSNSSAHVAIDQSLDPATPAFLASESLPPAPPLLQSSSPRAPPPHPSTSPRSPRLSPTSPSPPPPPPSSCFN